jgi:hypothetical protein
LVGRRGARGSHDPSPRPDAAAPPPPARNRRIGRRAINRRRDRKPFVDPFTARAGALVAFVLTTGFGLLAVHALATGCIRLKTGPHGAGLMHCRPERPYWVASVTLLALVCLLALAGARLTRIARRRPEQAPPER